MKRIALPLLVAFPVILNAGQATFNGTGTASRAPEFISVDLSVKSNCYAKPSLAREANKSTAISVLDVLKKYVRDDQPLDRILSSSGFSSEYSRTIYVDKEPVTVCRNTFQRTTNITFETGDLAKFDTNYDDIQEIVLDQFLTGDADSEQSQTFVTIGSASGEVCEHTKKAMSNEALERAVFDAQNKWEIAAKACGIAAESANYVQVGEPEQEVNFARSSYRTKSANMEERVQETNFANITATASVTLKFVFPDTAYQCLATRGVFFAQ